MNFLKRFSSIFQGSTPQPEELARELAPTVPLARFVTSSNHYRKGDLTVKPAAFIPFSYTELSVYQIQGLATEEVQQIGITHVGQPSGKNLYGHATIKVADVTDLPLEVNYDNSPPRHANIVGWPSEKPEQKLLALKLAAKATFTRYQEN